MLIIKPYGKSSTSSENERKFLKKPYTADEIKIKEHFESDQKLIIARYISVLDKIISKPKGDRPTELQYHCREKIGKYCKDLAKKRFSISKEKLEILKDEELNIIWQRKIHPYNTNEFLEDEEKDNVRLKGRWFSSFCDGLSFKNVENSSTSDILTDEEAEEIAKRIDLHLHEEARSIHLKNDLKSANDVLAKSIADNVLSRSVCRLKNTDTISDAEDKQDDQQDEYFEDNEYDLAETIQQALCAKTKINKLEKDTNKNETKIKNLEKNTKKKQNRN